MLKLTQFGIKDEMLKWINDCLHNRKIKVRAEDQKSDFQETENGSSQGVVLSLTLFNAKMDTLKNSYA